MRKFDAHKFVKDKPQNGSAAAGNDGKGKFVAEPVEDKERRGKGKRGNHKANVADTSDIKTDQEKIDAYARQILPVCTGVPGAVAGTAVRCGLFQLQEGIKRQGKAQNAVNDCSLMVNLIARKRSRLTTSVPVPIQRSLLSSAYFFIVPPVACRMPVPGRWSGGMAHGPAGSRPAQDDYFFSGMMIPLATRDFTFSVLSLMAVAHSSPCMKVGFIFTLSRLDSTAGLCTA